MFSSFRYTDVCLSTARQPNYVEILLDPGISFMLLSMHRYYSLHTNEEKIRYSRTWSSR